MAVAGQALTPVRPAMDWSSRFAGRTGRMQPSAIREILKLTQSSDVISLAGGLPSPELFPVREVADAARAALDAQGRRALQYGPTEGLPELREEIAARLPRAAPEQVLVVSGSQQALDLAARILLDPGDAVAVAAPCYMGALRAFDAYEARYLPVPCDEQGMLPDALEAALARRPKLLYVIPDYDNPSAARTSLQRRHALLEAAARHDVPVLEDAPYRELRFEGEALPTLHELAPERVLHAGTLSKTMAPGLRVAWLVAPPEVHAMAVRAKQAADLHTGTLVQVIAHALLAQGLLEARLPRLRAHYQAQRDALHAALERTLAGRARWRLPPGGMFLWLTLEGGIDATALLREAVGRGVAFVPGAPFFADGGGEHTLRLSYSMPRPERLALSAERLAEALEAQTAPA